MQNASLCHDNLQLVLGELNQALTTRVDFRPTDALIQMIKEDCQGLEAIVQMGELHLIIS